MNKKTLQWLLILSVIINIATLASFSYYRWFKIAKIETRQTKVRQSCQLHRRLQLSQQQSKEMRKFRFDLMETIRPMRIELNMERRNLIELIKKDSTNISVIEKQIDSISDIQKHIQIETINNMIRHQSILTPKQKMQFKNIVIKQILSGSDQPKFNKRKFRRHGKLNN